jgi:dipeptidyl-peptidase-3
MKSKERVFLDRSIRLFTCIVCGLLALAGCSQKTTTTAASESGTEQPSALVERVGSTGFLQIEASSFRGLQPRQQVLAYWLTQAAIAIDPIIYDQMSRWSLRQKRLLEALVAHPQGIHPEMMAKITAFTKLFWANRGNHNDTTAQKFLPDFNFDELKEAGRQAMRNGLQIGDPYGTGKPIRTEADFMAEIADLRPSLFDADFEPLVVAKSPQRGLDILQASANNFYFNVQLSDLKGFHEKYPLNSRVVKMPGGKVVEQVYRVGTPDGHVPPGLYAQFLKKAIEYLEKALPYAEPGQEAVIRDLIRFYQTGEYEDWLKFGASWVQNSPPVDFANGFIEVYLDARGAKGTSQAFVSITDQRVTSLMGKIAENAQYFEDRAPWDAKFKKQGVKPPLAKAVETVIETGDFHVTTIGDNLPNEDEIHQKYGTKSFMFTGSTRAFSHATGHKSLEEFAYSREEIERAKRYGDEAEDLMTALHEIIGHGSGKLDPKLKQNAAFYLKEYFSTLEEARADLMALWNAFDPKLRELGAISSPEAAKAMYDAAAMVVLTQLRRIPKGDTIEEDHQRDRALIANYIMDKTGAIARVERDGKAYVVVRDYDKMRQGAGMLLAELMRIKGEGDYAAIKVLVNQYGVHFDPALRDQIVARFKKLDLPVYWAGINSDLTPKLGPDGQVTAVEISYPRDVVKQQLGYAAMYGKP